MGDARVIELGRDRFDESVEVLTAAFAADPSLRHVCRGEDSGYDDRRRALFRAMVRYQLDWDEPRLGVLEGDQLVGVCHLARPGARERIRPVLALGWNMAAGPGWGALARGARLAQALGRCHPHIRHFYIVSLGVDPRCHGRGHGGRLLNEVITRATAAHDCQGIALDTQNRRNVDLYRRFGFEVGREERIGPLDSWCLFRPRR